MAIDIDEGFLKAATRFDPAMPGESLTVSPDETHPWDGPPTFTKKTEALEYYFELFTSEDIYSDLMGALESGVSIMDVVKSIIYKGFQEGLINPDMMLILAEPLAYMLIALAERAKINFIIDHDDEEDEEDNVNALAEKERDESLFQQAISTIEAPEAGEEFPEEVKAQLRSEQMAQSPSLLGGN